MISLILKVVLIFLIGFYEGIHIKQHKELL